MLNVGMMEFLCFVIVVLLVLGFEKLFEVVCFVVKWYGKVKCFMNNV